MLGPSPAPAGPPRSLGSLRGSAHPKKPSSPLPRQPQEAAKAQQNRAWKEELQEVSETISSPQHSSPCEIWEPVLPLTQLGDMDPTPGTHLDTPGALHVPPPGGIYTQESRGVAALSSQAGGSWQPCQGPGGLLRAPRPWPGLGPRPHAPCASREGRGIAAKSFQPD